MIASLLVGLKPFSCGSGSLSAATTFAVRLSPVLVLRAATIVTSAAVSIPVVYLCKSLLGIDLMEGPSPLHDMLFWLVEIVHPYH